MTTPTCCRVPALARWLPLYLPLSLALAVALPGCGGIGSAGEDVAGALVDGVVCGLRNCTESSTLNMDEISPRFTATQAAGDNAVVVEGGLGKSANVFTSVLMAPNEQLAVSVDGSPEVAMSNPDGKRLSYTTRLTARSTQPVVQVVFTRGGVRHVSQVTLPTGFTVLQPAGAAQLTRTGAALPVRLSMATVGTASASASGTCTRTDGSSFTTQATGLNARIEGSTSGAYRLEPTDVDEALTATSRSFNNNDTRTPAVSRCALTVTWTHAVQGSTPATMNRHGALLGQRTATHPLSYDAQL